MDLVTQLKLKLFDIDAHSLRGKSFYKSIVDYREKILPNFKHRIQKDEEYVCTLCKHSGGLLFLEWREGYRLFQCKKCGAVSPNISIESEAEHIGSVYDNQEYKEKFMRETHAQFNYRKQKFGKERFEYTVQRLGLKKGARVLDLGCGAGYYLGYLKDKGIECKGLEVAPHFIEYNNRYNNLNIADTSLHHEENSKYDLITLFDVLEHLANPIELFKVIRTKLKKDGYCVAYTPNIHSVGYQLMQAKQNTLLPFEHLCFFNESSFDFLVQKSGFKIMGIETFGLDIMDYLLMKEYEDNIEYTKKLGDMMQLLQAVLDKYEISNHFRITFKRTDH